MGHRIVRGFAVAVAGSVFAHAIALAWFAIREPALPPRPPPPVTTTPPAAPPVLDLVLDLVLDVVFLDEPARGGAGVVTASTEAPSVKRGRITKPGGGSIPTRGEAPAGGTGERNPYMTMRRPGGEGLQGPSAGFWANFENATKPLPPPPDIPGERLQNEIADLRAKLRRAGRYSPDELAGLRAELVAKNAQLANEELKPAGGGSFVTEKETFRAKVKPDGSVTIEEKAMDLQDRIAKRHGIDSYAANKLRYLDRTRDQRVAIGKRYREQELKKSVIYMQQNIAQLWSTTTDPAKRKQGLFELWDECLEDGTPEEIAGGEAARAFVMSHIRALGLTPAEVRAFDKQRRSKQPFAP